MVKLLSVVVVSECLSQTHSPIPAWLVKKDVGTWMSVVS